MKALIFALCGFQIFGASVATAAGKPEPSKDEVCKSWGHLALRIMEFRQLEIPMSRAMELAGDEFTRSIVIQAYGRPAYETARNQQRESEAFRNKIELQCFKAASK